MSSRKRTRIISRESVREVIVVVVGILIAFSLDAWWDRSSTNASLKQQADLVLDELLATEHQLQSAIEIHERLLAASQTIVDLLDREPQSGEVLVADTMLADLLVQNTVDIGSPSMESFLDSGGSRLIEDGDAVRLARSWPTQIDDTLDDQVYLRENFTVPFARYLRSTVDLGRAERNNMAYRSALYFGTPDELVGLEYDVVRLTPEMELLNHLNARITMEELTTVALGLVLDSTQELISVFEEI